MLRFALFGTLALLAGGLNAQLTVTLTGAMYNGTNVPCFGMKDGTITSSVAGGTAPYTYLWSTGATTTSITAVPAGYYLLTVKDAIGTKQEAQITLTEPEPLKVFADPYVYPNGKNISCFECFNGSIDVQVIDGTQPYAYIWQDAAITTQDRTGLGAKSFEVTVTDANGCVEKAAVALEQPESSDWKMGGNANTNPETQYIGSSDNKDVVIKANGQEAVRLKANGDISLMGGLVGEGVLVRGVDGKIGLAGETLPSVPTGQPCRTLYQYPFWSSAGNAFSGLCPEDIPRLGTLNEQPLRIITNGQQRIHVTSDGAVGIGTSIPSGPLTVSSTHPRARIDIENRSTGENSSASSELRFMKNGSQRWGLGTDFAMNGGQDFYLWDNLAVRPGESNELGMVRLRVDQAGKVVIGDLSVGAPDGYRLFVQEGILTDRLKVALHTGSDWSDHVFAPGYQLMPLTEVSKYITAHGHLPGVASATEMVKSGLDVPKTDAMLLEKIEELTLHIIAMNKRIVELEDMNGVSKNK